MPNRVIKESIKRSPQIDSLTWFEEVVFYRLIVTADDYGCMDGRPILLKNELFPTRENVTRKSVEEAITKLVAVGLLFQYEVDGRPYLAFPTWEKHQRIRNKHRKFPAPPDDIHLTAIRCQVSASCLPESESNPNPNPKRRAPARLPFGAYGQVKLTADEYQRLIDDLGQKELDRVLAYVDEYVQTTGKRYEDFNAVLRKASREGWGIKQKNKPPKSMQPGTDTNPTKERIKANADWLDEFLASQEAGSE